MPSPCFARFLPVYSYRSPLRAAPHPHNLHHTYTHLFFAEGCGELMCPPSERGSEVEKLHPGTFTRGDKWGG